jgi:signal transduction histidine kinase/CheY-like chemotaxis protein
MSTPRWVLSPRITAGFTLAFGLFLAASVGSLVVEIQSAPMDVATLDALPIPARDLLQERVRRRTERRIRNVALTSAATLVGALLAATTLVGLDRQTRRRMAAEAEREGLIRAEVAQSAELRAVQERARHEEALRRSSEASLRSSEQAKEERERAFGALRAARIEAERANLAKDEFLAVLSHELRSPLHAQLGWLSILKKGLSAGRNVDRALETVERNVHLQARLVNDLLDVSRIVFDKLVIEHEPVDLAMVVRSTVEDARPAAEAKGVAIVCTLSPLTNAVVGDEKRLRQMVGNLLANAVKFTPSGGQVTVTLGTRDRDEAGSAAHRTVATVSVGDTGTGISPDLLPHVFDRFRLADAKSTRSHGGLGLGLTIVKTLTQLHGGRIEASSEGPDRGATFTLHLPLGPALAERSAPASDVHPSPGELAGVSALLVEDDPDGREALRLALEHAGASVQACGSPADARVAMALATPDVLVSDIGMPGEDGHAFLRWVRAQGNYVPAVAITGFASKQDREEAMAAGFDEHVPKPIDTDALVLKLRDMVRRSGPRWRNPESTLPPARGRLSGG